MVIKNEDNLPLELSREFVRRSKKTAVYIEAASSAKCPLCGNWGDSIHKCVKRLANGRERRYFQCPECGFRYSAEGFRAVNHKPKTIRSERLVCNPQK